MIAVGSDDDNPSVGGKVQMQEYNDITRYSIDNSSPSQFVVLWELCLYANRNMWFEGPTYYCKQRHTEPILIWGGGGGGGSSFEMLFYYLNSTNFCLK